MHVLVYHIPFFIQQYGCIKKFTGQGVEKNNDDAKKVMCSRNLINGIRQRTLLLAECRQWQLRHHEREKGPYAKRKLEYWNNEINEIRKKKRGNGQITQHVAAIAPPTLGENLENFTVKQLKDIIKNKNLKPKGLSKLKKTTVNRLLKGLLTFTNKHIYHTLF
jgi:hypothetical protein